MAPSTVVAQLRLVAAAPAVAMLAMQARQQLFAKMMATLVLSVAAVRSAKVSGDACRVYGRPNPEPFPPEPDSSSETLGHQWCIGMKQAYWHWQTGEVFAGWKYSSATAMRVVVMAW